jgi:hypothetical protein
LEGTSHFRLSQLKQHPYKEVLSKERHRQHNELMSLALDGMKFSWIEYVEDGGDESLRVMKRSTASVGLEEYTMIGNIKYGSPSSSNKMAVMSATYDQIVSVYVDECRISQTNEEK